MDAYKEYGLFVDKTENALKECDSMIDLEEKSKNKVSELIIRQTDRPESFQSVYRRQILHRRSGSTNGT